MKKILWLLCATALFAQIKTISVDATGFGTSYSEAVQSALVNAVAQVHGIGLKAKKEFEQRLKQVSVVVDGEGSAQVRVSDGTLSKVSSVTGGFVKRFDILYVKRVSPHEYEAKVRAYFDRYKSPGHDPRKRRSLAVAPFGTKPAYRIGQMEIDGKELAKRLNQSLVTALTQTRKFTMLDREHQAYYNFEKRYLLSGDSDPTELARLGRRLGADYYLLGEILDFGITKQGPSRLIGASDTGGETEGYATVAYRILVVPTQQIKWSDTVDIEFPLPDDRRAESLIAIAGKKIARVLTDQLIYNIFPPKIVGVRGREVILNMGGNTLDVGDRFVVYGLGKRIVDPYTHESLGREEKRKGEIEIVRVTHKMAYGRIVSGNAAGGDVVRPAEAPNGGTDEAGRGSMFDAVFGGN